MAVNPGNIHETIVRFGDYYRRRYSIETGAGRPVTATDTLFDTHDLAYFDRILHQHDISRIFENQLDLDAEFYHGVKDQIESLLGAWNAVLQEKLRYDMEGWPSMDRQFMESFVLCTYMIPKQVRIGYLGSHAARAAAEGNLGHPPTLPIDEASSYASDSGISLGDSEDQPDSDVPTGPGDHEVAIPVVASGVWESGELSPVLESEPDAAWDLGARPGGHEDDGDNGEQPYSASQIPLLQVDEYSDIVRWAANTATLDPHELLLGDADYPDSGVDGPYSIPYLSLDQILQEGPHHVEHDHPRSTSDEMGGVLGITSAPENSKSQPDKAKESSQGSLVPRKRKYVEVDPEDMAA